VLQRWSLHRRHHHGEGGHHDHDVPAPVVRPSGARPRAVAAGVVKGHAFGLVFEVQKPALRSSPSLKLCAIGVRMGVRLRDVARRPGFKSLRPGIEPFDKRISERDRGAFSAGEPRCLELAAAWPRREIEKCGFYSG
jgi:hypothetical protein